MHYVFDRCGADEVFRSRGLDVARAIAAREGEPLAKSAYLVAESNGSKASPS
jgi:hypothetical protein